MKQTMYSTMLFTAVLNQTAFSASGQLFNINASGITLSITTTAPNHTYPAAGIKINTPGVTFSSTSPGCTMAPNGYCLFAVSDKTAANIVISSMNEEASFTLCLNGSSAISCQNFTRTLTGSLVTVGYYQSNNGQLASSYTSNNAGKSWVLSNDGILPLMPLPVDSAIPYSIVSRITSCDTTSENCIAIGNYIRSTPPSYIQPLGSVPLAYSSSNGGKNWTLSNMPLPNNIYRGSSTSTLASNTCDPSVLNCTAVGQYSQGVSPNYTILQRIIPLGYSSIDRGKTWELSSISLPADIMTAGGNTYRSFLRSATCDLSGQICTSVGRYAQGVSPDYARFNGYLPFAYSSSNGGKTWTLSATLPIPSNAPNNNTKNFILLGTACDSIGQNCTALGSYIVTNNGRTSLGYSSSNGGKTWALSNQGNLPLLPSPANAVQGNAQASGDPFRVSCNTTGSICIAISVYNRASSSSSTTSIGTVPIGYTSSDGGQTWTLRQMPLPADIWQNQSSSVYLSNISCDPTGKHCVIVGNYNRGVYTSNYLQFNGQAPFSYSSSNGGQTWTLSNQGKPLPLPDNAATGADSISTYLYSVSCKNTSLECIAVGEYTYAGSINGDDLPLAYTSKDRGNTWVLSSSLPLPSNSSPIYNTGLQGVN